MSTKNDGFAQVTGKESVANNPYQPLEWPGFFTGCQCSPEKLDELIEQGKRRGDQ